MGLDITAYRGIGITDAILKDGEPHDPKTEEYRCDCFVAYTNPDFPGRSNGIQHNGVYSYEEVVRFRAGSYSGYNSWREQLAKLAGYPAVADASRGWRAAEMRHDAGAFEAKAGPFFELIHFSDCEGIIGSEVSKKLLADFRAFRKRASEQDDYFFEKYKEWEEAFTLASDRGAVSFH